MLLATTNFKIARFADLTSVHDPGLVGAVSGQLSAAVLVVAGLAHAF